jgi:predicted transcriptional regulator
MKDTLTIPLTPELRAAVDRLTETEGLSPEGLVQRALQEFIFVHQFIAVSGRVRDTSTQEAIEINRLE